jgi:hypothetical protein
MQHHQPISAITPIPYRCFYSLPKYIKSHFLHLHAIHAITMHAGKQNRKPANIARQCSAISLICHASESNLPHNQAQIPSCIAPLIDTHSQRTTIHC